MRHIIRVNDFGSEFLTRRQGQELRERLVKTFDQLTQGDSLSIDFSGVETMTPSFADECFGKFAERVGHARLKSVVAFVGANETVRSLVNSILSQRFSGVKDNNQQAPDTS